MEVRKYLSFDIGGTSVKWGILDESGMIHHKDQFSSNDGDSETVLNGLREKIVEYKHDVNGVSISAPGFINSPKGYIENGGTIKGFHGLHLQKMLEEEFPLKVSIENDANCAALAEKWLGKGKGSSDFLCITIGTAVGGGLVLNDQLYSGHAFRAGEFGYMITQGIQTNIPKNNSLNRVASMKFLRAKYAEYYSMSLDDVTGEDIFRAYDDQDPVAIQMVESFYQSLALGIYNLCSVLNPEKVLLGGAVTSRPSFLDELNRQLNYINQFWDIHLDRCHFRNDAGLVGAVAYYREKYEK
ncbi:ROK family protein [Bacillus shivajii]|uniref:ROK family protein n=1 Tax=Bacillus shivajii TaxID=1983719 RepID=UPI001CF9AEDF|nr:ROK family protein [Bacillus shivajii]UCZ53843.1 ROK family protein [Bacillus shivajii]